MKKQPLTSAQTSVLRFVRAYQRTRGFPPTRTEISAKFKWKSKNSAQEQLEALARKGWLRLWPETPRGISVL